MKPNSYMYAFIMAVIETIREWLSKPCSSCNRKLIDKDCFTSDCVEYYGGTKARRNEKIERILKKT